MFKRLEPKSTGHKISQFPHCDPRILHAPNECEYCDMHSDWQELRLAWHISFTGYSPEGTELPCPADAARGDGHKSWGGNIAKAPHNHLGGDFVSGCPACSEEAIW